jgi:DNA-binding Lrp family transcriptional regulator
VPYFASSDPDPTELAILELLPSSGALPEVAFGRPPGPNGVLRDVDHGAEGPLGCDGREAVLAAMVELRLDRQGAEHIEAFERCALADVAVRQVWRVSPGPDFVLIVQCADMAAYHTLTKCLFRQKWNVRNVKTRFALRRSKAGQSHRSGKARGRPDAWTGHLHKSGQPPELAACSLSGHQMPWADYERRALEAAGNPVAPCRLQPAAGASTPSWVVGWEPGRGPTSVGRRARVAAATGAVVFGFLDGAALQFRTPHFFVEEVRALSA